MDEKAQIAMGRAAVAAGLSVAGDTFMAGRVGMEPLVGAAEIGGAVLAADYISRSYILPGERANGVERSSVQLLVEPALAAGIVAGLEYARTGDLNYGASLQTALADVGAGVIAPNLFGIGVAGGNLDNSFI